MRRWPILLRGLVIAVCGVLLAAGGCLGFLATMDNNEAVAYIGAAGFFIGLLTLLAGAVMVVIGVFKWLFGLFEPKPRPRQE